MAFFFLIVSRINFSYLRSRFVQKQWSRAGLASPCSHWSPFSPPCPIRVRVPAWLPCLATKCVLSTIKTLCHGFLAEKGQNYSMWPTFFFFFKSAAFLSFLVPCGFAWCWVCAVWFVFIFGVLCHWRRTWTLFVWTVYVRFGEQCCSNVLCRVIGAFSLLSWALAKVSPLSFAFFALLSIFKFFSSQVGGR